MCVANNTVDNTKLLCALQGSLMLLQPRYPTYAAGRADLEKYVRKVVTRNNYPRYLVTQHPEGTVRLLTGDNLGCLGTSFLADGLDPGSLVRRWLKDDAKMPADMVDWVPSEEEIPEGTFNLNIDSIRDLQPCKNILALVGSKAEPFSVTLGEAVTTTAGIGLFLSKFPHFRQFLFTEVQKTAAVEKVIYIYGAGGVNCLAKNL